jgi:hypothetical protein
MISVKTFSGGAELRALAPGWRALTARLSSKRHFHYVEWYLALAETFDRHNLPPLRCIAVFSADQTVAAVFPFRFVRIQIGPMQLNAARLASDHIDAETARDFVMAPGLPKTTFFQGFVSFMAERERGWDVIQLPGITEDSFAAAALKHSPQLPIIQTPGGAWGRIELISCIETDPPLGRLSKGFKQNLRTAHNKLIGNSIVFECVKVESDLLRALPEFLRIESSGWKGELGTSMLKLPAANTFIRQLIFNFSPIGGCQIHFMRADNNSIATLFGIATDRTLYIFRIGYDETRHRASPGHLIIENLLKQTAINKSIDIVTPYNAPPWFRAWKPNRTLNIYNAYVFRPSSIGADLARRAATILRAPGSQH